MPTPPIPARRSGRRRRGRCRHGRWTSAARTALTALLALTTGLAASAPAKAVGTAADGGAPVRGVLERVAVEPGGEPGFPTAWVRTDGERIPIDASAVRTVATGSTVAVTLAPTAGEVRPSSGSPRARRVTSVSVLSRASSTPGSTPGPTPGPGSAPGPAAAAAAHGVTVVLALPAGVKADSTTTAGLTRQVNGGVATFWSQAGDGRFAFSVSRAVTWTKLTSPCSDVWAVWDEVRVRVRFVPGARKHLLVYVPSGSGCPTGLATVGTSPAAGGYAIVGGTTTGLLAHELGHNLGLGHSDALACSGTADAVATGRSFGAACRREAYGDWYDVMGISWENLGSLSTAHAYRLGLLGAGSVVTARGPVRATLRPVSSRTGVRSLRIEDAVGAASYVVEYRPAQGADAWLGTSANWRGLRPGVLLRRIDPDDATQTLLLDGSPTPASTSDTDVVLAPGQTVTTASGRVSVTVESMTAEAVSVAVAMDGVAPAFVVEPRGRLIGGRQVTIGQALAAWGATAS